MTHSKDKIKMAAESCSKSSFNDHQKALIGNQLKVLELYPSFFSKEDGLDIGREITLDEIHNVLHKF